MTKHYWIVADFEYDTDAVLYLNTGTTSTSNMSYSFVPKTVRHDIQLAPVLKFDTKDDTKIYIAQLRQRAKNDPFNHGRWNAYKIDAADVFPESYVTRKVWDD